MTDRPLRVIVTGGAGGIGTALARRFGIEGARIALLDRDRQALDDTVKALTDSGVDAKGYACDVTDRGQCETAVNVAVEDLGGLDVLMNNAGITHISLFKKTDPSVIERVMAVNFFGSLYCTHAAIPSLLESKGRICVTSSISGFAPLLGRTGYCASKYALHGLFETIRTELVDDGVSVTMACPIFTESNLHQGTLDGEGAIAGYARSKTGRMYTADEVADGMYRATIQRKRLIVFSGQGKLSYWLSRVAPALYDRGMRKRFKVELRRGD